MTRIMGDAMDPEGTGRITARAYKAVFRAYSLTDAQIDAAFAIMVPGRDYMTRAEFVRFADQFFAGLQQGVRYVWEKPDLLGAFSMAFLVNLLAYPFFLGLLPYVARDVYGIGQSGLGFLAGAFGSLAAIPKASRRRSISAQTSSEPMSS